MLLCELGVSFRIPEIKVEENGDDSERLLLSEKNSTEPDESQQIAQTAESTNGQQDLIDFSDASSSSFNEIVEKKKLVETIQGQQILIATYYTPDNFFISYRGSTE